MTDLAKSIAREKIFNIPAFDKKSIYCVVNYAGDEPSDKAVILAHGLTGQPNEYVHMAARDYFKAQGYDVYRLAFYWFGENYRVLHETTLAIHALDLNSVIAHIRPDYKKLYVCGHSYGGLTLVFANPQADAIAFWDPSFYPWSEFMEEEGVHLAEMSLYSIGWGMACLMGKAMYTEAQSMKPEKANPMAAKVAAPSIVIQAEKGGHDNCTKLYDALTCKKEIKVIKDADHCFTVGLTVQPLLETTQNWFKKFGG